MSSRSRARRLVTWLGGLVVLAAAVVAPSASAGSRHATGTAASAAGSDTSTLIISRLNDPTSFDPGQEVTTGGGLETLTAFYDRLIDLTPSGGVKPALATSWSLSKDHKTYTFNLRRGVTFHDGSKFDAAQVRYTWQRIKAINGPAAQYWAPVKNVVPVGPYKVKIVLAHPTPSFLVTLGGERGIYMGPDSACVKAHEAKPGDWAVDWMASHECGTGPYTLESWQHDQEIRFTQYPDYWRGWKGRHVKTIVQKIVKEPSTAQLMLEQGSLDLAADPLPISVVDQLRKNPDIRVDESPSATINQFTLNVGKKPLSDVRVRRAIAMLFDYDAAIKQAYHGYAKRVFGPIPSTLWPPVPKASMHYDHNVAAAKRLLAQAGYANGFTLDLSAQDTGQWRDLVLVFQSDLAAAGIKVNVSFMTWPVLFQQMQQPLGKKPFDVATIDMNAAIPDPSDILMWWKRDAITVINPGWGNAQTDRWISNADSTFAQGKRVKLYRRVITKMNADAPGVWATQPLYLTVMRKDVHGYRFVPYYTDLVNFYDLYKTS